MIPGEVRALWNIKKRSTNEGQQVKLEGYSVREKSCCFLIWFLLYSTCTKQISADWKLTYAQVSTKYGRTASEAFLAQDANFIINSSCKSCSDWHWQLRCAEMNHGACFYLFGPIFSFTYPWPPEVGSFTIALAELNL